MSPDTFFKINVLFFSHENRTKHTTSQTALYNLAIKKKIMHHFLKAWVKAIFTYRNLKVLLYFVDLLEWPAVWNSLPKISKPTDIIVNVMYWMKYQLMTNIHTSIFHWLLYVVDRYVIKMHLCVHYGQQY